MTLECTIDHKHHRSVLGSRGANVQAITSDYNVSIKFPDRVRADSSPPPDNEEEGPSVRDIILVTGRKENAEAAIKALKVCVCTCYYVIGCIA